MKCLFIINPSSGTKVIQKNLNVIIGDLILNQIVNHVDTFYTQKKNDAYDYAYSLSDDDYDFIVSVGGDGTVNEVISGMVKKNLKTPLAILAGGTVNDFANHLKLPSSSEGFLNMIRKMNTIPVDVGKVNDGYFVNVIAGGMFSDIAFHVSKVDKEKYGPFAYYASGLRQLPHQLNTKIHLKVTADSKTFEENARLFMITNTSQVGGFKGITPKADIQDGQMDLLIIKKCNTAEMLSIIKDYTLNSLHKCPYVTYIQAKNITIECNKNIIYDVDGEIGKQFPIQLSMVKEAINIIIP